MEPSRVKPAGIMIVFQASFELSYIKYPLANLFEARFVILSLFLFCFGEYQQSDMAVTLNQATVRSIVQDFTYRWSASYTNHAHLMDLLFRDITFCPNRSEYFPNLSSLYWFMNLWYSKAEEMGR